MLSAQKLRDCLEAMGAIAHVKVNDVIFDVYYSALENKIDDATLLSIFESIIDTGKWVSVDSILKQVTGVSKYDDWDTIMQVASGSIKSAEISGISELALIKATNKISHLGALRYLVDTNSFETAEAKKKWAENLFVPANANALPPASVTISFDLPKAERSPDPMTDDDFSARTAAMIRCIRDKKAISAAWVTIIDRYPAEKRREVYEYAAKNGFMVPEATKSKFYQRSIDTARAVVTIDESTILAGIRN